MLSEESKIKLIRQLWSVAYDLLLYNKGQTDKTLKEIEWELDILEYKCRELE